MAFITHKSSSILNANNPFPIKRTATMDTSTSHLSHSSSTLKGSFRGSRRTDHLMKLIQRKNTTQDDDKNLIQRVRLSNSFAKEHHQLNRHTEHTGKEKPLNRYHQMSTNQLENYRPMRVHRNDSLPYIPLQEKRRLLHRYSTLSKEGPQSPWRRGSDYVTNLSKRISFSPNNSSLTRLVKSLTPPKPQLLQKFRHAVRIIQIMIRAVMRAKDSARTKCAVIPSIGEDLTSQPDSIQAAVLLAKSALATDTKIIFDPGVFKANQEQQISNDVRRILRLPIEQRSESCLHKALVNLRNVVDVFSEFPLTMQQSLVKVGWYECFEAKRVLTRQGYHAERYYLILNGSAMVMEMKEDPTTQKISIIPKAILTKGSSFGEDALMKDGVRDSTVIVEKQVEVLMIEKDDFVKIFLQTTEGTEPELLQFLRSVKWLSQWPVHLLRYDDPKRCLQVYFRRGNVVCKEATSSEWVYIIKSGSCRVVRRLSVPSGIAKGLKKVCQYEHKKDHKKSPPEGCQSMTSSATNFQPGGRLDWWNDPSVLSIKPKSIHRQSTLHEEMCSSESHHVFVHLQQLNTGDTFGLLPIVFPHANVDMRDVTLISNGAECVMISRRVFAHYMNEEHLQYLQTNLKPLPSEEMLQNVLKERTQWIDYKRATIYDAIGTCSKFNLTTPRFAKN